MKTKINRLQIFRIAVQLAFLILLPALFALVFSELKQIYILLMKGNFDLIKELPDLIEAIIIIPMTIVAGRFFCGWLCAFGTFNDLIFLVFNRLFRNKVKVSKSLDAILKYLKYALLIFIVFVIWTMGNTSFDGLSPWNAFAQLPDFTHSVLEYTFGFLILAYIAIGAMLIERFFCRYLCPLGAIFSLLTWASPLKLRLSKPTDKCGKCRICTESCSMGIQLNTMEKVNSGECISCFKCTGNCPRKNIKLSILNKNISAEVTGVVIVALFIGLYYLSGILGANTISPTASITALQSSITAASHKIYKDGSYTGIGLGYRPELEVSVTIKNDKITGIVILSDNETPRFSRLPFEIVPQQIIETQSTNVDIVSGATRTSEGIMQAVEDALNKAKIVE